MALKGSRDQDSTGSGEDGDTVLRFLYTPSPAEYTFDFFPKSENLLQKVHSQFDRHDMHDRLPKDYSVYVRNEDHHIAMRNANGRRWRMKFGNQDREVQHQVHFGSTDSIFSHEETMTSALHLQQRPVTTLVDSEFKNPQPFHRATLPRHHEFAFNSGSPLDQELELKHNSRGDDVLQPRPSVDELNTHSARSNPHRLVAQVQQFSRGNYDQQMHAPLPWTTDFEEHPCRNTSKFFEHHLHYEGEENQHDETAVSILLLQCRNPDQPRAEDPNSRQDNWPAEMERVYDHQLQRLDPVMTDEHQLGNHSRADRGTYQRQEDTRIPCGQTDCSSERHPLSEQSVSQHTELLEYNQIPIPQLSLGVRNILPRNFFHGLPAIDQDKLLPHDQLRPIRHLSEKIQLQLLQEMTEVAGQQRCHVPLLGIHQSVSIEHYLRRETAAVRSPELHRQFLEGSHHQQSEIQSKEGSQELYPKTTQGNPPYCLNYDRGRGFSEFDHEEEHLGHDLSIQQPEDQLFPTSCYKKIDGHGQFGGQFPAVMNSINRVTERIAERSVSISELELALQLYEEPKSSTTHDQQLDMPFYHPADNYLARSAHGYTSDVTCMYDVPPSAHLKTKAKYMESLSDQEDRQLGLPPGVCCQQFLDEFQLGAQADIELGYHTPDPNQPFGQSGTGDQNSYVCSEEVSIDDFEDNQDQGSEFEMRQDATSFGNGRPAADSATQSMVAVIPSNSSSVIHEQEEDLSSNEALADNAKTRNCGSGPEQLAALNENFPRYIKLTEVEMVQALRKYKNVLEDISIPPVAIKEADVYRQHPASLVREKGTHYFFVDTRYSSLKKPTRLRITATRCRWKQQGRMFPIRENGQVVAFKTYLSYVRLKGSPKRATDGSTGTSLGRREVVAERIGDSRKGDDRKWSTWTMEEIALVEEITAEKTLLKRGKKPRAFSVICRLVHKRELPCKMPVGFSEKKLKSQGFKNSKNGTRKLK